MKPQVKRGRRLQCSAVPGETSAAAQSANATQPLLAFIVKVIAE